MLAHLLGLPKQSEILVIIFLGICFLSVDFSLFEIKSNLEEIWNLELDKTKSLETVVKYIISAVILVRTFTLHVFLAFYIVMLWPAIFEEKPNLMLPWLLLGMIRCLILNVITFAVGTFICQKEKGLSPICLEYVIAQVIEHGPSVYAWISVLRELAGERSSNQSSLESLHTENEEVVDSEDNEENKEESGSLTKSKSHSLSDLNLDYIHSSRFRALSADMPLDVLLEELSHLVSKTKIIRDPTSKSFDSLSQDKSEHLEVFGPFSQTDLTIIEKTMRILDISESDVSKAKEEKDRLVKILEKVSIADVDKIDTVPSNEMTSISFYIRHGKIHKGVKTHVPKSLSLHEDSERHESCLCNMRRKLQQEHSKLTLVESEIANIKFDETDKNDDKVDVNNQQKSTPKCCVAKCKNVDKTLIKNKKSNHLNRYRVVVGASLGFNTSIFLQKFVLKKNTSKNFGCQVSMLRQSFLVESRNELAKKLAFLRNFRLL